MDYSNITERRVLCYGDSNTYGYDPAHDGRYGETERYPRLLQAMLGNGWAIMEEGLPGRTAVFDDPITEGLNGLQTINPILMSHAPLDTVTIMLGTNDSKARFNCNSYLIALGITRLVKKALHTECWRDNAHPDVLVIVPPSITADYDKLKFRTEMGPGCHERCAGWSRCCKTSPACAFWMLICYRGQGAPLSTVCTLRGKHIKRWPRP